MERMHDGRPCPDYIQAMMNTPQVLMARRAIRLQIAEQDRQAGDTLAEWRNSAVAGEYYHRATQGG